jgi:outer membrane protein TolC
MRFTTMLAFPYLLILAGACFGQRPTMSASAQAPSGGAQSQAASQASPLTISLQDAMDRARANESLFRAAVTQAAIARQDVVQARAGLLPSVNATTGYLYTQGGTGSDIPRFIANNAIHEYTALGNAHEEVNLGPGSIAAYRRASAASALARAQQEVALRGLMVTVVQNFYGMIISQRAYANAQQASVESQRFLDITQQRERAGDVAHADVIKAQIQRNTTQQNLEEAQLEMERARLSLAVLLFPNFNDNFTVVDDLELAPPLPTAEEARQMAARNNPELQAALAAVQVARHEVQTAWAGHFPTLALDVWYGIDALRFATYTGNIPNLGYSAAATLNIPVFSWGATQSRVKQAQLQRTQSEIELSAAQRAAIANLRSFYAEAQVARAQLDTLRQSADLAAESLRLTNLRYQAAEATALEVVDAQNTLVQARDAYGQGEARYRVAIATLQTLTGTF